MDFVLASDKERLVNSPPEFTRWSEFPSIGSHGMALGLRIYSALEQRLGGFSPEEEMFALLCPIVPLRESGPRLIRASSPLVLGADALASRVTKISSNIYSGFDSTCRTDPSCSYIHVNIRVMELELPGSLSSRKEGMLIDDLRNQSEEIRVSTFHSAPGV
ncbi:hypothetical protein BDZ97DRAFT_1766458 [Flammula alnicola]|nr:hypothetical protein BDZ97DRAFT_1766458 [Flammula alnicola]